MYEATKFVKDEGPSFLVVKAISTDIQAEAVDEIGNVAMAPADSAGPCIDCGGLRSLYRGRGFQPGVVGSVALEALPLHNPVLGKPGPEAL